KRYQLTVLAVRRASRHEFINGLIAGLLAYDAWRIAPAHGGEDTELTSVLTAAEDDLSWDALKTLVRDARRFWEENGTELVLASVRRSWYYLGVDFAANRNGHGTGFWAHDLGEIGDQLSAACKP